MSVSTYLLNGHDITPFITRAGVSWQKNVIDGPNAGRTMDGYMILDTVTDKRRMDFSCMDLNRAQFSTLLGWLSDRIFSLTYRDPELGVVTKEVYTSSQSATLQELYDEDEAWGEISFSLIER